MSQQFGELAECYWHNAVAGHLADGPREVARCRGEMRPDWEWCRLVGYVHGEYTPYQVCLTDNHSGVFSRKFCQIYTAPVPGEGYRAIDPWVDNLEFGDEIFDRSCGDWARVVDTVIPIGFKSGRFYRRKIGPVAAPVVLKKIVDKCNYGLEGPNATETFLPIPPLREDDAKVVAGIINRAAGPNSHRFYAVVDLDYELFKFEV